MSISDNSASIPNVLLVPAASASSAVYIDVNPHAGPGRSANLQDAAAVFGSIRNLFLCPKGGRSRIYRPDYFSGVYELLQEPFDVITSNQLEIAIYQALRKWEPRVTITGSDVSVTMNYTLPGYIVSIAITVNGQRVVSQYSLPISGQ